LTNPFVAAAGTAWAIKSLRTSISWPLPVLILAAVVVLSFFVLQGRLDRRDPKMARAPMHSHEDTIGFD
jgi:hypothetical protein